ncbi:MAG: CopG family transcriptional regulator [Bacteroidetes bacterium]|jgi:putative iron-only hydrogenase system regulator|nr:CopG family transcriptional regulator [Bacteroidota bacterium]
MEKRIGSILILINDSQMASAVNQVLTRHAPIILGRQGLPLHYKGINIISLIVEGEVEEINSLSGQLGRISQVQVKTVMAKPQANDQNKTVTV